MSRLTLKLWIKILVGLGVLGLAIYLLDWDSLISAVQKLNPWLLVLTIFVLLLELPILGFRWYLIVLPNARLPFMSHFRRYLLAVFLSSFTPAQLGGDVYRYMSLKNAAEGKGNLAAAIFQERLIGLISFMVFYLLCFSIYSVMVQQTNDSAREFFSYIAAFFSLALCGMALSPVILNWAVGISFVLNIRILREFLALAQLIIRLGSFFQFMKLLSLSMIGGVFVWTVAIQIVTYDADIEVPFVVLGMIAIIADMIRVIPISIQGLGVREAAFAYMFNLIGYSAEQGFIIGGVSYALVSIISFSAGTVSKLIPNRDQQ